VTGLAYTAQLTATVWAVRATGWPEKAWPRFQLDYSHSVDQIQMGPSLPPPPHFAALLRSPPSPPGRWRDLRRRFVSPPLERSASAASPGAERPPFSPFGPPPPHSTRALPAGVKSHRRRTPLDLRRGLRAAGEGGRSGSRY
jgi:hypothetical protein